jgi:hypothetical protein
MKKLPSISERAKSIVQFEPERHRLRVAAIDYSIKEAKKIKDWPALEEAVDAKIAEQFNFIAWWDAKVREAGQPTKELSGIADNSLSVAQAKDLTGMAKQRVSDLREQLERPDEYRTYLLGAVYCAACLADPELSPSQRIQLSGNNERNTPAVYIEAARQVLGGIDLDPASNDIAQQTVQAGAYFTEDNDGLAPNWRDRVWLNPPYGGLAGDFVDKLMGEIKSGRVSAAICVVNSHCTDTQWFQPLWDGCLCFTDHRVNFTGGGSHSTHGSVFVYFGPERDKFMRLFRQFGECMVRGCDPFATTTSGACAKMSPPGPRRRRSRKLKTVPS